jgi:recombination protein RecA
MPILPAKELDKVPYVRTGLFVDRLLGGGIPKKKIVEFVGEPGAGKSTLCMQMVAALQKEGQRILWVDSELSWDVLYGEKLGVDGTLDVLRAETAEETLDAIEDAVVSGDYDYIFLDSIGGLTPKAELEKRAGEATIASAARLLSPFMRKIVWKLERHNVGLIVITHMSLDLMSGAPKAGGGKKLEYHKSASIMLKKKFGVALKQGENIIGHKIVASVWKKNKLVGNVGTQVETNFIYNTGFSAGADILDEAIERGIITKEGNTYYFSQEKLGMISKVRTWIQDEANLARVKELL